MKRKRKWLQIIIIQTTQLHYVNIPEWSKFFFVKTPKRERLQYLEIGHHKAFIDGYYHGSKREFIFMLKNSKSGKLSRALRLQTAWDLAVSGYFEFIKDWKRKTKKNI